MYETKHEKFELYLIGVTALICGIALALVSLLGPLGINMMQLKTSPSGIIQIKGQDLVSLVFVAPLCLIGGILHLRKNENSKYFLILVGIYTSIYTGLAYGIGQEWNHPTYTGNAEDFFWLFYILMIGGLILFISSISMFTENDAPDFNPRSLKIYIGLITVFLIMFASMWIKELLEVVTTGNTSSGSYLEAPNLFWVIRYLDLGLTIPLGFIGLYLLGTRPKKAYPLILAFFGFFITLSTAVLSMAIFMVLSGDPNIQSEGLIIFPILTLLAWAGFFYLIKSKLTFLNRN